MSLRRPFQSARPAGGSPVGDAVAGVELAAMSIPQSLGYASIAGMPAVSGLYTLLLPLIGFAAFGSSRYLVVAADSATAAILAGGIASLPPGRTLDYATQVAWIALFTAVFLLAARLLKLGFLADFLSQTVLTGFLTGVGLQVAIGVLGPITGIPVGSHRTVQQIGELSGAISHVQWQTVGVSAFTLVLIVLCMRLLPRIPAPLLAVVASIAVGAGGWFSRLGIATVGAVTPGLPHLRMPLAPWRELEPLMPIAASCFVMILTQSAATARTCAFNHHQRLDENDDLTGLAAANALAAISGAFVVNGSPTQTTVVESLGAKSQLAQLTAAVVVGAVLMWSTGPLQYLPRCVLGSIVLLVAVRLMKFSELGAMRRESPGEFWLAAAAAVVVLLVGVEEGIVAAMVVSLARIVQHSYRPHTGVLLPDERGVWRSEPATPGAITEPGLIAYRFGAPLFYANAGRFADEIRGLVAGSKQPLRWLVVDAGAITRIDFSAAAVIRDLQVELKQREIGMVWTHVEPPLEADLLRHRLEPRIFDKLHDAVDAFHRAK